jgi:hypothetical protein
VIGWVEAVDLVASTAGWRRAASSGGRRAAARLVGEKGDGGREADETEVVALCFRE